jgi:uncharacterized membrane protein
MNPDAAATRATREELSRRLIELIVLVVCVASLAGVVYLLAASTGQGAGEVISAVLGIASVAGTWTVVHTVFTVRYARLYYSDRPGAPSSTSPSFRPTSTSPISRSPSA